MGRLLTFRTFIVLLAAVTAVRAAVTAGAPLSGDEAYYWLWAKHLSWGYYDHPPLIAFLISLFTTIGGDGVSAIRASSMVLGALSSLLTYLLARQAGGSERAGVLAGLAVTVCPIMAGYSLECSTDMPLMTFSLLYGYCTYRAVRLGGALSWLLSGAALGLAVLSKLIALLLPVSLLIFLLASKDHRHLLRTAGPYMSLVAALLVLGPFLQWCSAHNWITFKYHFITRLNHESYVTKNYLLDFLAIQAAAYSPFLFLLCVAAIAAALHGAEPRDPSRLYLLAFGALPLAVFGALSLRYRIFPHWTIAGYPFLFVLGALLDDRADAKRAQLRSRAAAISLAFAFILSALLYLGIASPGLQSYFVRPGRMNEMFAYPELTRQLASIRREAIPDGKAFILTDSYSRTSSLWYYLGGQAYLIPRVSIMGKEFLNWQSFDDLTGRDALYVDTRPLKERDDVRSFLEGAFTKLGPEQLIRTRTRSVLRRDEIVMTDFYVTLCRGFVRNTFYHPVDGMILRREI